MAFKTMEFWSEKWKTTCPLVKKHNTLLLVTYFIYPKCNFSSGLPIFFRKMGGKFPD